VLPQQPLVRISAELSDAKARAEVGVWTEKARERWNTSLPSAQLLRTDCGVRHWVQRVTEDGALVQLEDNSLWKIEIRDRIESASVVKQEVFVCDRGLVNTDTGDVVVAVRIQVP